MSELESFIERKSVEYAKLRGWWEIKLERCNKKGMPDRMLSRIENGAQRLVFIEFKKLDEAARRQQAKRHREMRAAGFKEIHVVDSIEQAKTILR